jgi:hypothetical protein
MRLDFTDPLGHNKLDATYLQAVYYNIDFSLAARVRLGLEQAISSDSAEPFVRMRPCSFTGALSAFQYLKHYSLQCTLQK